MFEIIKTLGLIPNILITIFALWVIIKAADYFVQGASSVALKLGMSIFVVGLTIVAIGTSAPELFVNGIAAYSGNTDLSIGNIIGSNIANMLLALGLAALITPLKIKSDTVWKEIPFSLLGALLILIFGMDKFLNSAPENILTRSEGLTFLAFFIIFLFYTFGIHKNSKDEKNDDEDIVEYSWSKSILFLIFGLIGLAVAGELTVSAASNVAMMLGVSQNLIGLTIVAIGTSLPEVITSIVAVKKGQTDLVVGGIIGSMIFNIFFVLGVTAVIALLPFKFDNLVDAFILALVTITFFAFMFIGKKHKLERWQGVIFILLYIVYLSFAVLREII